MNSIYKILDSASPEERQSLAEILESASDVDSIVSSLQSNGASKLSANFFGVPGYSTILRNVCKKLKLYTEDLISDNEFEIAIAQKVFSTALSRMSVEQKKAFETKLAEIANEFSNDGAIFKSASIIGVLTAAQLSGFGVYVLATTSLGALTGVIGITLPFAIYTSLTSAISIAIGPVGWLSAGLYAFWNIDKPNYKKLIRAILFISVLRNGSKYKMSTQ